MRRMPDLVTFNLLRILALDMHYA
ncbi:hypothetical protein MPC4_130031 [Methylocella tundrae]|uniref:Uncharacterized protein n=1 Tax=Methylocella tundrae TaxID=227605 RepID=A0A8B6M3Z1_METTU|nr:hypothetical protein MPC1_1100002 [Methylocella tundrae]VTZ49010.1 hypothetical protein MPC4_130031 [Methylocella tundrae]